jgi:signal transduction histidine kinase
MFKLLRYYSVTSFVAILATAVLLTWFYRRVAVEGIFRVAERGSLNVAQVAMNPIRPELLQFLASAADVQPGHAPPPPAPDLAHAIDGLMHEDHFVARIKIYNLNGVVVFSTKRSQIGDDQRQNKGFQAAKQGSVRSELVYRDTFNSFDEATEEDNLIQTYLPIRASPAGPVQGVFELYGDVNDLMHQNERTQFLVIAGAVPILLALYAVLLLVVRHANRTIEQQQHTIQERNETLALMAAHMLRAEESHKKQVALDLQEGVAQNLAALKLKAESNRRGPAAQDASDGSAESIIPLLQEAIQDVRTIATDLRPSSLDDLGLLPTINTLRREFEQRHPGIQVEQRNSVQEADIPAPLKDILHRIIASVLADVAQNTDRGRIQLAIDLEGNTLALRIDVIPGGGSPVTGGAANAVTPPVRGGFSRMEELATLSGGTFTASPHPDGGWTLRAAWNRQPDTGSTPPLSPSGR